MMPRKDFNVKKKLREEEELLDADLRAAGLWEEGLSLLQKRRLMKFIADSKSSAQEEEDRRKIFGYVEPTSLDQDITEVQDAQVDDSDPIITYESPSTNQNRKQICNREKNSQKNCNNSSNSSSSKETAHSSNHSENKILTPSSSIGIQKRVVKSLLSESFIEISSTSDHPKASVDKENLIISESDDENTDPQVINTTGYKSVNDCDDIEEIFRKNEKNETQSKTCLDKVESVSSYNNNSSIQTCAVLNKPLTKIPVETNDKGTSLTVKAVQSLNLEKQLNCISLESSTKNSQENNISIGSQSESKTPSKNISEDIIFTINRVSHPDLLNAQRKRKLINENPNLAYFKSSYETETKCVKRICSLITEWQLVFANHQRSLTYPCKWGPPICVERKVDGLKKTLNRRPIHNFVPDVIYDYDVSESDFHISDQSSGEEFEMFSNNQTNKKKKAKLKKQTVWHRSNNTKGAGNNTTGNVDMKYGKSTNKFKLHKETQLIEEPTATTSSSNLGAEMLFDDQKESSNEGLWIDPLKNKSINPHKFYKKPGRKTFQLTPDKNHESIDIEESNSLELPDLDDNKNSAIDEIDSQQHSSNHKVNSLNLVSSSKNSIDPLNTNDDKRVGLKRKGDSDSLSLPPFKKSVSKISKDSPEQITSEASCHKKYEGYDSHNISPSTESQEYFSQNENKIQESRNREDNAIQDSINSTEDENKHEKMEIDSREDNSIACPLCQIDFPIEEIEAHASECNGPVEHTPHQEHQGPSTSTGISSNFRPQYYKSN